MKQDDFNIQRRISSTIITIGVIVTIFNLYVSYKRGYSLERVLTHPSIISVTLIITVLSITYNINNKAVKVIQLICLFSMGLLSMFVNYKAFYGMGMYIIAIFVMHRYRYFKKWIKLKIGLLLISVVTIVELSATLQDGIKRGSSIYVILFILFFLIMMYILYTDEVNKMLFQERSYQTSINSMIEERNSALKQVEELNEKIKHLKELNSIKDENLSGFNFTSKELEIVEYLCTDRMSNKELAEKLFVSEGTIKQHLNKIYKKSGIKKRVDLIDMFRHNFDKAITG